MHIDFIKIGVDSTIGGILLLALKSLFYKINKIESHFYQHFCQHDKKLGELETHISYIKTAVEAISEIKVKRE